MRHAGRDATAPQPQPRRAGATTAQTAAKTRAHLEAFSGRLSAGLAKPARRFVCEALLGIAARGSVRLSEIGRALEEPIALAKTETRLSGNLARPELASVGDAVLAEGAGRIGERTLLVLDLSDITKPYVERMEHHARVHDGSSGAIADGYRLAHVVGVENEDNAIVPLYAALWSQKAPDFVSENEEILTVVRKGGGRLSRPRRLGHPPRRRSG